MRRLPGLVLICALAAGCGGSSAGPRSLSPAPSPPASPTPAASPTGTPEEQVLAAVRTYYAAVDTASATGDVTGMNALTLPSCDCRKLARGIADSYRAGDRVEGVVHTLIDPHVDKVQPLAAFVSARLRISAHVFVTKDGSRKSEAADEFPIRVLLARKADQWLIIAVEDAS